MLHRPPLTQFFSAATLIGFTGALLAGISPAVAQLEGVTTFNIPDQDAPGNRTSGGIRSDTCADTADTSGLMALVPDTNVGLTTKSNPDLFAYVPPNNAERAELRIFSESTGEEVYAGTVSLPANASGADYANKAAVVSMPLSSGAVSLQPGENYLWALMLVCNGENRAEDIVVQAVVQQIGDDYISSLPEDVSKSLSTVNYSSDDEKLATYSSAGLWQDLLAELAPLADADPAVYGSVWIDLLTNQGMGSVAEMPVYTSSLSAL
jgi:hypothetical protein